MLRSATDGTIRPFGPVTEVQDMVRDRKPPSQTWRTFLANHAGQVAAVDFFTVSTVTFRVL